MKSVVFEVHTLPESLAKKGHNVYVVDYEALWKRDGWRDLGRIRAVEQRASRAGIAEVVLVRPGFIKVPMLSRISSFIPQLAAIEDTVKKRSIDVVVLYAAPTNGLQTLYVAGRHGVPVVFRSIDILHRLCPPLLMFPTLLAEEAVYRRVDRVFTITPALSDYVATHRAAPDKVSVLPLGIDADAVESDGSGGKIRGQWGLDKQDKVVMFVGTLPEFSGLDIFLPAFAEKVRDRLDIKLMVVGDGVQRARLEELVKGLGIGDRVVLTGMQAHEDVPKFIGAADVCISTFPLSKTTRDIFPTKVLQYMAGRKPTVSTPLEGLRKMGVGTEQGVVFAENGGQMAETVVGLLGQEEYRRWMGDRAREYVCQNHDQVRVAGKFERELEEIVKRRREQWNWQ